MLCVKIRLHISILWEIRFCINVSLILQVKILIRFAWFLKGSDSDLYLRAQICQMWAVLNILSCNVVTSMTFTTVWEVPSLLTQHSRLLCMKSFFFKNISNALALIWLEEIKSLCVHNEDFWGHRSLVRWCLDSVYSYCIIALLTFFKYCCYCICNSDNILITSRLFSHNNMSF